VAHNCEYVNALQRYEDAQKPIITLSSARFKEDYMPKKKSNYETLMNLIIGLYILKILQQEPAYGNKLAAEIKRLTQDSYTPNTNAL